MKYQIIMKIMEFSLKELAIRIPKFYVDSLFFCLVCFFLKNLFLILFEIEEKKMNIFRINEIIAFYV